MRLRVSAPVALAASLLLSLSASAAPTPPPGAPPLSAKVATARVMVSAANPLAVEAGVKVLRRGGSAVDAAVAIQALLGLVEPQSSGVGGGAFMVFYDAKAKKLTAYDGREFAPAGATPQMFLGPDGRPLPFGQAVVSGRATGVPGAIAMLYMAQKEHGTLPWRSLFTDAARLADQGFTVSPRLANFLTANFPQSSQPDVKRYFTKANGQPYQAGDRLKNPAYAATLRRIAARGPDALLKGPTAERIVARLHAEPIPGSMTLADLAAYRPKKTEGLCRPYRQYVVCGPEAPSGGVAVLELLGILEHTDIASRGPNDPQAWYEFAQASRLMYADRDHYIGDPAFVKAPIAGLLDPAYTKARAALVGDRTSGPVTWGQPMGALARGEDRTLEPGGTSSFVIADAAGNVVAMTTTVESIFGNGRMVDGFFLNNQMTDFSFSPTDRDGRPAANAVGPHKRPRSSMSPTIVLDRQGRFVAAVGSPGGPQIPAYVAKSLVAFIDWKMPMNEAINLPNVIGRGDRVGVESTFPPAFADLLRAKGLTVTPGQGEESGLHGLQKLPDGRFLGAADPRREGIAKGF
jgi:gamma-glutamyltranspeptidase/glutathione hydrolase